MSFKRDVFRLLPSGIVYDLPPDALEPNIFTGGINVVFRDGLPERANGYGQVYGSTLDEAEFLLNLPTPLVNYWLYPGKDKISITDGTAHYDITPTTTLLPTSGFNRWTGGLFNGIPIFNNNKNDPVYWPLDVTDKCLKLPGWPSGTKCLAMRPFKYHIFAFAITNPSGDFPDMVMWSEAAEPGAVPLSWTPTPENDAGFVSLSAGGGAIIDAMQLRDSLVIFKENSTWLCQYVGGNDVFLFRKSLETSGIFSRNCSVEIKGMLIVMTDSDVIVYDGQTATSIIDGQNRTWLFSQIDPVAGKSTFLCKNWLDSEVWICFPSVGSDRPNVALVWSFDTKAWGVREIFSPFIASGFVSPSSAIPVWSSSNYPWSSASSIWNQSSFSVGTPTLLASVGGLLMNYNGQNTNNGTVITSNLTKTGISLGNPQARKLLKRIWPHIDAANGTIVTIRAGAHDEANSNVRWSDPVTFIVGEQEKIDTFANGRYLALSLESNSVQPWRMTGFDVEYTVAGGW